MKIAVLADDINDFKNYVIQQSEIVGFNITQGHRTVIRSEYGVSYHYITCISQTRTPLFYDYVNVCDKTTPSHELIESLTRRLAQCKILNFTFSAKSIKEAAKAMDNLQKKIGRLKTLSDFQRLIMDMKLLGYAEKSVGDITIVIIVPRWYQPIKRALFIKRLSYLKSTVKFRKMLLMKVNYKFVF